jgi:hypothetical protein
MGGNNTKSVGVNAMNDICTSVFSSISLNCTAELDSFQDIELECVPQLENPNIAYEDSPACQILINNILEDQQNKYAAEVASWAHQAPAVRSKINQDFQDVVTAMIDATIKCKACVYQDLSEQNIISDSLNCQALNSIQNQIDQQLSMNIQQSLTNNTDFLAPLAQMLGSSSTQAIVSNIASRMSTKLTDTVIANINNSISTIKTINFKKSGSVIAKGVHQKSVTKAVTNYLQKIQLFNTVFSEEEWTILQSLANSQNTIGEIGNAIVNSATDMSKMLTNIVGKVVFFAVIVLIVVAIAVFSLVVYKSVKKVIKYQRTHELKTKQQNNIVSNQ